MRTVTIAGLARSISQAQPGHRLTLRQLGRLIWYAVTRHIPRCQFCGRWFGVALVGNATCYQDQPRKWLLCEECAGQYNDYWTDMWQEYWDSQR